MSKKKRTAAEEIPGNGVPSASGSEAKKPQTKKKRRWHFGDRYEGRRLRTLAPMQYVIPYIMKVRADSQNHFEDRIDMDVLDEYCAKKQAEGLTGFGALHAILAAYVRTIAERPGINRFVAGQHVYARHNIVANMTIKKRMGLDCPDTVIKVIFDPADTADDVYRKFKEVADKATSDDTDFDNTAGFLRHIPGLILRGVIGLLRFLDYFGLLLLHHHPSFAQALRRVNHAGNLDVPDQNGIHRFSSERSHYTKTPLPAARANFEQANSCKEGKITIDANDKRNRAK